MKNILKNFIFKLEGFDNNSTEIINKHIILIKKNEEPCEIKYKITSYLGKGTVGQVYLLEPINSNDTNKYVIKISNSSCLNDLKNEIELVDYYFRKYDINHSSYPIYWGYFSNLNGVGVIYPYLGFYNLDKIKNIRMISWDNSISIIKQIINQLIIFKKIIHGDLKPSNVVVEFNNDKVIATIIDFGLIKKKTSNKNIISTNYITSPESLLTLEEYHDCSVTDEIIDKSKHDYYGLYSIILNLFLKHSFWYVLNMYMIDYINFNSNYILTHRAIDVFVYVYYKFFYNNHQELPNDTYRKLIYKIEMTYPTISTKKYYNFDNFFNIYIVPNIDLTKFNMDKITDLKDFISNIYHFDPTKRLNLEQLLKHPFLFEN